MNAHFKRKNKKILLSGQVITLFLPKIAAITHLLHCPVNTDGDTLSIDAHTRKDTEWVSHKLICRMRFRRSIPSYWGAVSLSGSLVAEAREHLRKASVNNGSHARFRGRTGIILTRIMNGSATNDTCIVIRRSIQDIYCVHPNLIFPLI